MLYLGSFLAVIIGLVHSYLGEKYILIRLFQRDNLPQLFGGDWFTKRVLRFAWHLTTVAWTGFAAILFVLATSNQTLQRDLLLIIGSVFLISGLMSAGFTKGRHLSWIVFWSIAGTSFYTLNYG
jgi:hypothetical protein